MLLVFQDVLSFECCPAGTSRMTSACVVKYLHSTGCLNKAASQASAARYKSRVSRHFIDR